jgi:hypothetical protein
MSPATTLHAAATKDCALKQYASLDLVGDPSRGLVVSVTIQDLPAYMILNTSNAYGSVTESAVRRLLLQTEPVPSSVEVFAGRSPIQKLARAKSFALGSVKYAGAEFLVVSDDTVRSGLSGILGMNHFSHMDIEIDVANRKLNLYSPDHCPGNVVYWSKWSAISPLWSTDVNECSVVGVSLRRSGAHSPRPAECSGASAATRRYC